MSIFLRRRNLFNAIMLLIFMFCCSGPVNADDSSALKNVLIINSYHEGLTWTSDETHGIVDTLNKSNHNISISVEYMDWKNYPSKENLEHLSDYFQYKYHNKTIDLIIATDDSALNFALQKRGTVLADVPVVFCGVNEDGLNKITRGYKNFTGVLEKVDPEKTIKMAMELNPELHKVYVLFDNSESGVSTGRLVMEKIEGISNLKAIPLNNLSYNELIETVKTFDKNSIILVTTYYSDVSGKIIDFGKVSRDISSNSNVPVYHLYDLGLNNGALGGNMLSGKLQGESAAKLALRILNGESPESLPVESPETTRNIFDYRQVERFDLPINRIAGSYELINKPFSFFETYKTLVLSISAAFTILVAFIGIMLVYIKKIRHMKKELSDNHEELTKIYEELAASDEELKHQYEEELKNQKKLKTTEERLTFLAYHDSLTGLPNKLSLYDESQRNVFNCTSSALLFIDMDNFKYINDTMGHALGDQLIIKASERLSSLLKDRCSLYRLSGDEFVVIIQEIKEKHDAEIFASHILAAFKDEFEVSGSVLHISLSIGIALVPEHGRTLEELLKYADIAMYSAKGAGRNRYMLYDQSMIQPFNERAIIEKYLHSALGRNEFVIHYQPQLDLTSNKITGFEALLRWKSSELGNVSPLKFIKVAEDTHLIVQLGTWVLRNACAFLKKLNKMGYDQLNVSVNISMLQLMQTDFVEMVTDTLDFYGLDPSYLELEITETILIESFETVGGVLESLNGRGIRIALDDFGKGYSSLSYLKHLPISTLKIDKSFIDNLMNEHEILTGHIVSIGKSMGMCVIAEGVEKKEQLEYLMKCGCNRIQGYLFSRAIPENQAIELLESM